MGGVRDKDTGMLKISVIERHGQPQMVLEGKLIAPWAAELKVACDKARADLHGRELVIDVENLAFISPGGENLLLELMNAGVRFRRGGVFTKYVLRQLARRMRTNPQDTKEGLGDLQKAKSYVLK